MLGMFVTVFIIVCTFSFINAGNDDYYKLLNVPRDASLQEVRKAFKVLALKLHPDKNKEDSEAESKFIEIAKAYETLRDPVLRNEYDLHGVAENRTKTYHSYTYYKDHFGIYDDDPIIITLSKNDYEMNILDENQAWFVNFYSPHCHHCHEMAPIWRKLAQNLEGVVRVAAVNCEEDFALCRQLSIQAYPTLLFYEKDAHLYDGEKFKGQKSLEGFEEFVLDKIKVDVKELKLVEWKEKKNGQLLLFLCGRNGFQCPESSTMKKAAAALEGLLQAAVVKDDDLCSEISENYKTQPIVLWQIDNKKIPNVHVIEASDYKGIVDKILNILPHPPILDEVKFHDLRTKLRLGFEKPWLICFYLGTATDLKLELKRLPTIIPQINIGLVHCGKSAALCGALHIVRYPTWGVVKKGGAFEVHHGRDVIHEVADFARDSTKSTNLHALSPADFANLRSEGGPWVVDWYAPWCPPCKRLKPELRRASQKFEPEVVQFGTIDCTLHRELCVKEGVQVYPSVFLYNGTKVQQRFQGVPNEAGIVEFIQDVIDPAVITLDEDSFSLLARKPATEMWIVDFYAPWCGPCQMFAPQYRQFAKSVTEFPEIKVAQVDCVANEKLCKTQNISGYPTVRLYPLGSKGMTTVAMYNGNRDAISMKRWSFGFLPTKVESFTDIDFKNQVLTKNYVLPWLVDFYAPWCGHCVHFEPEFRKVAQKLDGKVRCAQIDCEKHRIFCGQQRVSGYPTVRLYFNPGKFVEIDSQNGNEVVKRVKKLLDEEANRHDEL